MTQPLNLQAAVWRYVYERGVVPRATLDRVMRARRGATRGQVGHALKALRAAGHLRPGGGYVATDREGEPTAPRQASVLRDIRAGVTERAALARRGRCSRVAIVDATESLRRDGWLHPAHVVVLGDTDFHARRGWDATMPERVVALLADGACSATELAAAVGRSRERVRQVLRELEGAGRVVREGASSATVWRVRRAA